MSVRVLIIGATGALGRPVARALVGAGHEVTALVRDENAGRKALPDDCRLCHGDLRDGASLVNAMRGQDAIYLSLAHPFSEKEEFDPDRDGLAAVIEAARDADVGRILRLSALGVDEGASSWWVASRKAESDERLRSSGVPYTIFRCDWFAESLPQLCLGRLLLAPPTGDTPFWWITGADYGKQVGRALESHRSLNKIYSVQGPQPQSFEVAANRFVRAYPRRLFKVPVPKSIFDAKTLPDEVAYLRGVVEHTRATACGFQATETWNDLGRPATTIEDYARSIAATGDFPQKPLPLGKRDLLRQLGLPFRRL